MRFKPQNRHLLIQTQKQEDSENTGVLLPEGYVVPKDKYVVATVKSTATDCKRDSVYNKLLYQEGARIVVDGTMIENVNVAGEEYEIVLENHIVGMFVQGE
tara:strand:- start:688 stop:990 length:303 start_codon:yes stop_codon:yes gene_type:complete